MAGGGNYNFFGPVSPAGLWPGGKQAEHLVGGANWGAAGIFGFRFVGRLMALPHLGETVELTRGTLGRRNGRSWTGNLSPFH